MQLSRSLEYADYYDQEGNETKAKWGPLETDEQIENAYGGVDLNDVDHSDAISEFEQDCVRGCYTNETEIDPEYSRHYESKSVAKQFGEHWIGWTYWYGGGKHGEPSAVEWIDDAYFLNVKEETKVVQVFAKV